MSRKDEVFLPALKDKRIPVLTLDNKWHQLFTQTQTNREIKQLEDKVNELIKKQGKANTEIKKIKALKKSLMNDIVEKAGEEAESNDDSVRLINDCNQKIDEFEDQLLELPRQIDEANRELMLTTMDVCYQTLKENEAEIEDTAKWITQIRIELKKRLIRKQEKEKKNQDLYSYMHDIFGAEVIEIFDLKYAKKEEDSNHKS